MSGVCIGTALKSSLGLEINVLQIHELSYLPNDLENVGLYSNDLVTMGESSSSIYIASAPPNNSAKLSLYLYCLLCSIEVTQWPLSLTIQKLRLDE